MEHEIQRLKDFDIKIVRCANINTLPKQLK